MIDMPEWLEKRIGSEKCPNCGKNLDTESIYAVGVKIYERKKKNKKKKKISYLYIEHACVYCGKSFGFDMARCTVKEFVAAMLKKYKDESSGEDSEKDYLDEEFEEIGVEEFDTDLRTKSSSPTPPNKSCIASDEIKDIKELLDSSNSFDDFLHGIGVSKQDIQKYIKDYKKEK